MHKKILLSTMICLACLTLFSCGREDEANRPILSVSKDAKSKLKVGSKITILLNGNDPLLTRILEDSITIHLANAGMSVVNRQTLDRVARELFAKNKNQATSSADVFEVARSSKADFFLTGTLFLDREKDNEVRVKAASFELFHINSEESVLRVLFQSEPFLTLSKNLIDLVKSNME